MVGYLLRKLRGDKTQAEVAAAIGVSLSAYRKYETGERMPRDETKRVIARYFNKSVQEIFFT